MLSTTQAYRSVFAGAALAIAGGSAFAAEPLARKSEFSVMSQGICAYQKKPLKTLAQIDACEEFVWNQQGKIKPEERAAGTDAVCAHRYKDIYSETHYNCRTDLYKAYNIAIVPIRPVPSPVLASSPANDTPPSALESCTYGMIGGLIGVVVVHTVATGLDISGGGGGANALVAPATAGVFAKAVAAGCLGSIARDKLKQSAKESQERMQARIKEAAPN